LGGLAKPGERQESFAGPPLFRPNFRSDYGIEVLNLEVDPRWRRFRLKYLCLVYGEEKEIGAMTDDECMAYDQALRKAGRCLASEALQPVRTATTWIRR